MPLIHFQQRFAADVASGKKRQTIRKERKRPIKPDDRLILGTWEGLPYRSKVRRLCTAACKSVSEIVVGVGIRGIGTKINGRHLSVAGRESLAKRDGFECYLDMVEWFAKTHGLPFRGVIIRW